MESFNKKAFQKATGLDIEFVQDNHSRSARGVLRGLHYQLPPAPQAKLVRVITGEIFDVAVDIRRSSPQFGQYVSATLSAANGRQLWIPAGFAHGFIVTSEVADVLYKVDAYYAPECEHSIRWDDAKLGIDWPDTAGQPMLSDKDARAPKLAHAHVFDP